MKQEQTQRETIENVVEAFQSAQRIQEMRLEQVRQETQADIDKFFTQANDLVHKNMIRYHAFKCRMLEDGKARGHNLGKEYFGYFYSTDPETFFVSTKTSFYEDMLVFVSESDDRNASFGIPLGYFNDPEAWEYKFTVWVDEIMEMMEKVNGIWPEAKYKPNNIGLSPEDDSFYLRSSINIHDHPTLRVEFGTGSVYRPDNSVPIACLR